MTKALGKDVWDFYLNGFPQEYSHDTWTIQIAYWPDENSARGAYSLLEDDKEYDLKDFGTLWDMTSDKSLTFEEAYLKWKGVEKHLIPGSTIASFIQTEDTITIELDDGRTITISAYSADSYDDDWGKYVPVGYLNVKVE